MITQSETPLEKFISKGIEELKINQNISPERLYVNVWRLCKNVYADSSMNNQDWNRWKYRYRGKIKSIEDAYIAINTILVSLNDSFIVFLTPDLFKNKLDVLKSSDGFETDIIEYSITDDNIGIITIHGFAGDKTIERFKEVIQKTNETKGIVIDLRNNDGGIVANAVIMANYMMDEDEIIRIKSRKNGNDKRLYSLGERIFKYKPIAVIINDKTASAAEILAGVLKTNLGAIIVGKNSYGKNSIQQLIPLYNGCGLILTTQKYILSDGHDISRVGLKPDFFVNNQSEKKDNQKNTAIQIIREIENN